MLSTVKNYAFLCLCMQLVLQFDEIAIVGIGICEKGDYTFPEVPGERPSRKVESAGGHRAQDAFNKIQATAKAGPLSKEELKLIDTYWRAANYRSVRQIYLYDNPLLEEPLKLERIKPRLLGRWGTTLGLNFIYVHLNRIVKAQNLNVKIAGEKGTDFHALRRAIVNELSQPASQKEKGLYETSPRL